MLFFIQFTLVIVANIGNSRWVEAKISDLHYAARRYDQSAASSHLASKEEGSALVGCVPQPPAQASISISIHTALHHRFFRCNLLRCASIEVHMSLTDSLTD